MSENTTQTLYKATNPQGYDFRTGHTIDYGAALASGAEVHHPTSQAITPNHPATYLSVSVEPVETLIGGSWPARLFRVEAVGEVVDGLEASPHKRAVLGLKVVEELPAWMALGPNGEEVAALIERARRLTQEEACRMDAAWDAACCAVRDAAWGAARGAVRGTAWGASAMLVRDLITKEQYDVLMAPWRAGVGEWA